MKVSLVQSHAKIPSVTQLAFTCSKLKIETLKQRCEICSKLRRRFGVFIVNFEHISHLCYSVSIVNFEHVIAGWEVTRTNLKHNLSKCLF